VLVNKVKEPPNYNTNNLNDAHKLLLTFGSKTDIFQLPRPARGQREYERHLKRTLSDNRSGWRAGRPVYGQRIITNDYSITLDCLCVTVVRRKHHRKNSYVKLLNHACNIIKSQYAYKDKQMARKYQVIKHTIGWRNSTLGVVCNASQETTRDNVQTSLSNAVFSNTRSARSVLI